MKVCLLSVGEIKLFPRMFKVAKSLLRQGYSVVAVCLKRFEGLPDEELYDGIAIRRARMALGMRGRVSQLPILKALTVIPLLIKALKEKADVYHCFHFQALLVGVLVKSLLRPKALFYDGLEDYPFNLSGHYHRVLGMPRRLLRHFFLSLELALVKKLVDFVFTVDSAGGILHKRYKIVSKNVIVVQNVPEIKTSIDEGLRKRLVTRYKGYKLLVYVGAIHRIRGCLNMVKAMKYVVEKVPNTKLLMIGTISDKNFIKEALEFMQKHDLNGNVELLGFVPYDKLHTYLSVCHLGLTLDIPEHQSLIGTPTKLFLYMRAGLPVIASDLPIPRNIIKIAKCGILVDPTNVKQIANAIIRLLKNPELAKQLGENGRKAIREKYNWRGEEGKILGVYRRFAEGTR